jgi:hypothetical protein
VAEGRGKPFWLALTKDCALPAVESAFGLVSEAVSLLGSADTEWHDDVGYGVVAACVYPTAHTADLLKFLARDRRFTSADQARLMDAARAKMAAPGTPVFTHGEDERLAAALLSVVRRPDFDPAVLDLWLARFVAVEKQVWEKAPPEPVALDASQNARSLLRSFFLLLSLPEPAPTPAQAAAREKVLATVQQIRR